MNASAIEHLKLLLRMVRKDFICFEGEMPVWISIELGHEPQNQWKLQTRYINCCINRYFTWLLVCITISNVLLFALHERMKCAEKIYIGKRPLFNWTASIAHLKQLMRYGKPWKWTSLRTHICFNGEMYMQHIIHGRMNFS